MTSGEAAGAFAHLGPAVRAALDERGFSSPTAPQRRAIPPIAAGEHVLVIAPTGTGKTETAMLPVLDALASARDGRGNATGSGSASGGDGDGDGDGTGVEGIGALYVTPLRALNRDMLERLSWWGERLDLEIDVRHGDTGRYRRTQQAEDPPDVLITTPETLQAMLTGSKLRVGLAGVRHVIVDEVHELAGSKRGAQLAIGLERLVELAGDVQRIGLSATVGDPDAIGDFLTGGRGCTVCELDVTSRLDLRVVTPDVTEEDERVAAELATEPRLASHVRAILELVEAHDSTLIFVNTRQTAEALGARFNALGANVGVHHGSLSTAARVEVEDAFKAGELDALLCTSSMELGIDVGHVDHVIQYSSPRQVTRLLQRVGRAGHRADATSVGTIVATSSDDALEAMAIVDRALAGAVEPAAIHEGSLDTLANQVAGMVMGQGSIRAARAYDVATRAAPFAGIDPDAFRSVVRTLSRNRIVWLEEADDLLERTGETWRYVYGNLSMIPDEETYEVHDVASGGTIGTLDEKFVRTFAAPGAVFVQRGRMWRIVEVDDDRTRVQVSPVEDPTGEVPSWVGQEIPVPPPLAARVGELRRDAARRLAGGGAVEAVVEELAGRIPADPRAIELALEPIERQVEVDRPIPDDRTIVVEGRDDAIVVNAAFGHRINETLGRLLSALLGQRTGSSVGLDADPYRIELTVPRALGPGDVIACLRGTDPEHVGPLIELSLKRSDALAFRLVQVAAKFGALKAGEGGSPRGRMPAERLLGLFEDTPIFEEAVREVFHEDLDVDGAAAVLGRIRAGELGVARVDGRTPIGLAGRSTGKELLAPEGADASVIETVRERLRTDRVLLACLHCGEWDRRQRVERVPERPECPRCGSTRIAALNPWADEVLAAVRADPDDRDEEAERMVRRAYQAASLVQAHGKRAVIALAARGVGPRNAARIINNHREDEADFYRDILEIEREYARTKAFWD